MKEYYFKLQENRKLKHEQNYKSYKMTNIESNIIIGSLLGDGTLSKYGRSLNACYRENTGIAQKPYRKWKAEQLFNLDFKIKSDGSIYSPSHPIYTELYALFYPEGKKILPLEGLRLLNHPIGLACLFMDDGTLTTSASHKGNRITIVARVAIYSQSFTKEENLVLLNHIKDVFGVEFKLSNIPSGFGYYLTLDRNNTIRKFLDIINPIIINIPSMKYKVDIDTKLTEAKNKHSRHHPDKIVKIANTITIDNTYSKKDEMKIIGMLDKGYKITEIASYLERSYYGLYDKVRRMNLK